MKVYEFILSKANLSIPHRLHLNTHRGFTDETIEKYRLVSGGTHLSDIVPELVASFSEEVLVESKTVYREGTNWRLAKPLLEDRVIIPYIAKDGSVYSIRPHKYGLKDLAISAYQEANLGPEIILTEGEFKAIAACQMGYRGVAIPGIGSFADKHFDKLVEVFKIHGVKHICVIFDNEVKDDPQFKDRYKEDVSKRYDTHFYSWLMAKMLNKAGFLTKIGWLPDEWRKDGKADIDGILADGRSAVDLRLVIEQSKTVEEFLLHQSQPVQKVIKKKNAKRFFRTAIRSEFGRYVATRFEGGEVIGEEDISNFTVRIVSTHQTPDGIIREVCFTNEFGESVGPISLTAESMASADGFAAFCLACGNFIWRGRKADLNNIWEEQFLDDDGRHIIEPDHVGYIKSERLWVFSNIAITKDGKEIKPDPAGVFWTNTKGIKPLALGVSAGKLEISDGIPTLKLEQFDIKDVRAKLTETIGENNSKLMLGWITAVFFLEEVFDVFNCFPFMFVTGRRRSGKSTIAEWMMNFFGLEGSGKGASDTTQVGLQRYLAYYSSLPLFVDEYRNTRQVTPKNGFLRNAYNRQSAGKGIRSDFGVREARVRGTLLISGEETPEDNALLTRCVVVNLSEKSRAQNHYSWFMANRTKFSYHAYDILRRKPVLLPKFLKVMLEAKAHFVQEGADDRTAINYAIIAAGYAVVFGEEDRSFADWISVETVRVKEEYDSEQATQVFYEDMLALKSAGAFRSDLWAYDIGNIYIYFKGMYNIWAEDYRRRSGIEPFKYSAMRDYLKEEKGFVELNKTYRISGQPRKCIVFNRQECDEMLQFLVE